jgi:hypothetical protein
MSNKFDKPENTNNINNYNSHSNNPPDDNTTVASLALSCRNRTGENTHNKTVPIKLLDVVGVNLEDNGHSCTQNAVCGHHINIGDNFVT